MAEIKQRIVSCPRGHYYDANAYASCPQCANGGFAPSPIPDGATAQPAFGETIAPGQGTPSYGAPMASGSNFFSETVPPNMGQGPSFEVMTPQPEVGGFSVTQPPKAVKSSARFKETIAVDELAGEGQPSPVVGWFVAISGPCRGTDYRIHSNYNYIGREVGDIRVHGDQAISAERDSSIVYVAKTKRFYIAHEHGLNTVLVNDEPVMGAGRELFSYDVVTIGSTQFVFIALCGSKFDWENGVREADE